MRVRVLGPLEVVAGGTSVEIGGARLRSLLIRLALSAGRVVSADALARAVWPDDGPAEPSHALQALVSRLRQRLPDQDVVRSVPGGYRLELSVRAVDALEFERLVTEGRRSLADGDRETGLGLLRAGLELWRGEALADVAQAPFVVAAVARVEELRLATLEDLLLDRVDGPPGHSSPVAELEELTAVHPLRERFWVLLVRTLHAEGRQAEALTAYERCRRLLADELGTDPGPELRAAHLAVLKSRSVVGRAVGGGRRGNLRPGLTSFVGRAVERAGIAERLTTFRLVTLVGPGGVGKTRLATTVAAGVSDRFSGGVWLVELAPVTGPEGVARAVINTLGVREGGLVEALSAVEAVIVLDNCEHLIEASARLVEDLLGRCPRLRFLVTSREPLRIDGEALFPVAPLPLPDSADDDAVVLFADRAIAVRPDFALGDDTFRLVAEICRRLDGLPLAIELAAARTRSLPVEELAARLDDRLRLLTGGSRTALARHRTLRAVVAWSWDLLGEQERCFARRLAVFPGGFSAEAAGRVCGPVADALEVLSTLVDRSLLSLVDGPGPRYRMLETIREYGLERLAEAGETDRVRAVHAAFFRDLAERAEPELRTAGQLGWIRRLTADRENLRAALDFSIESGDSQTAVRLAGALGLFWAMHGDHSEALLRLRRALDLPGGLPGGVRAVATGGLLLNAVFSGQQVPLDAPEQGSSNPLAVLAGPLHALMTDDITAGLAAVDFRLADPDPWTRAMLWLTRGMLDGNNGDLDALGRDLRSAIEEFRAVGERCGLAFALLAHADTRMTFGDFDCAITLLEESVAVLGELEAAYGETDGAVLQRVWLAAARARKGDLDRAQAELTDIVTGGTAGPSSRHMVLAHLTLGDLARRTGDLQAATRHYATARADLDLLPDFPPQAALLRTGLAHLAIARGAPQEAHRHLETALDDLAAGIPDMPIAAGIAVAVAGLLILRSAMEEAAEVLGTAQVLGGAAVISGPDAAALMGGLRLELGERAHQAAFGRGAGLRREDALTFIRSRLPPGP